MPVYNRKSKKRDHSGARRVVKESAEVKMSLLEQKRAISLADSRLALEIYKARKHGSASSVGGNQSEVISSN